MALELALRVDNVETAVPKQYPDLYKPSDNRLKPDPARRAVNARLGMGASSSPSGPLTHEWCFLKGTPRRGKYPARGPRVYQGTTNILDSDRHPPEATWLPV